MSNLTIAVEEQLIKRARVRAIEEGTSLSAKVREFLRRYVDAGDGDVAKAHQQATARLMRAMEAATAHSQAAAAPLKSARPARKAGSLRDEIYAGDFRAAVRTKMPVKTAAAKAGATPRKR